MTDRYTVEIDLDRASGAGAIVFRLGRSLSVVMLITDDSLNQWLGEVGTVSRDTCLVVVEALNEWLKMSPHPRVGRKPLTETIAVTNYGTVRREKKDGAPMQGSSHPDGKHLTLVVESERDAKMVKVLFQEMADRLWER